MHAQDTESAFAHTCTTTTHAHVCGFYPLSRSRTLCPCTMSMSLNSNIAGTKNIAVMPPLAAHMPARSTRRRSLQTGSAHGCVRYSPSLTVLSWYSNACAALGAASRCKLQRWLFVRGRELWCACGASCGVIAFGPCALEEIAT